MKYISIKVLFLLIFISLSVSSKADENNGTISSGNKDSKIIVKVFSSLTCPHCANFHNKIFKKVEKDFILKGKVRFEHHAFPLDLAPLKIKKDAGYLVVENTLAALQKWANFHRKNFKLSQ